MNDERGFTLVETLTAAIILTVALVALAELLVVSIRMHQIGRDSASAARMAQDKVEEMMKMNFTFNPAIQPSAGNSLDENVAPWVDQPEAGYTRRWRVTAGPVTNTRVVTVRIVPDMPIGTPFEVTTVIRSW